MKRAVAFVLGLGVIIAAGVVVARYEPAPTAEDLLQVYAAHEQTVRAYRAPLTRADYERLADGISYREAASILRAPGTEQSRSRAGGVTSVMYVWQDEQGGTISAMFQGDQLITKAQAGLQ